MSLVMEPTPMTSSFADSRSIDPTIHIENNMHPMLFNNVAMSSRYEDRDMETSKQRMQIVHVLA